MSDRFVGSQTVDHAETLLDEVLTLRSASDAVLSPYFQAPPSLGSTVRGLMADAIYGVLRQRNLYMHLAANGPGRLQRRLLLLSFAELNVCLDRVMSDEESQWLEHAINVDHGGLPALVRSNLPEWLWERLSTRLGIGPTLKMTEGLDRAAPLDLRVNRIKSDREAVLAALPQHDKAWEGVATRFAPDGIRLHGKPSLAKHPLFLDGSIEVQDEGSQLLAQLVAPRRGEMVVDFCAGAGGKTLALGALMRNAGRLYAFDVSAKRLQRFGPRLKRSGLSNVHPVVIASENDPRVKRLAGKIDRVLVDAPCSGLGTLRRNPDLKWRQTPASIIEMTAKQAIILNAAAKLVKPGGRLVYATCSVLSEENEDIADAFAADHPDFERVSVEQELARQHIALATGQDLKLLPHTHGTDGFYAAIFERKAAVAKS
ncbi:RsmB/NOP family class I SAM-dependent RNA methyltransferase [soil metagenome]